MTNLKNKVAKRMLGAPAKNPVKKALLTVLAAFAALCTIEAQTVSNQDTVALEVVNNFFGKFKSGATPEELANFFDEKAELYIPGDTKNVPWIGKRTGRKEIAESFRLLKHHIQPEKLLFTDMVTKGNRVVVLGYLESRMKRNGNIMKSEFSIDIVVENGLLTRYHLLEDSFEVSRAVKPLK